MIIACPLKMQCTARCSCGSAKLQIYLPILMYSISAEPHEQRAVHCQCAGYKLLTTLTYSFLGKKFDQLRWYCYDSILSYHFLSGRLRFAPFENGVRESHSLCLELQCEWKLNKLKVVTGRGQGASRGRRSSTRASRSSGTRSGSAPERGPSHHCGTRGETHCLHQ